MAGDIRESFVAANSIPAYAVVGIATAANGQKKVGLWNTITMHIVGVAQDAASTDGSVPVATRYGDICKVMCGASVSSGALVGPETATGLIIERALLASASTLGIYPRLGIALQPGSANQVIDVLLQPQNLRGS